MYFFAYKMHFKLPKLDGFKITVVLAHKSCQAVTVASLRMVTPKAEFCGVTVHNV